MKEMLRLIGGLAVRQIQSRIRQNRITPGSRGGSSTLVKTGALIRSIKYRLEGDQIVVSAGSKSIPYARIHHEGGVIRPRIAKYLAIPLTKKAALYSAKDYPGETYIAKGVIFDKGENIPIYALKKEVIIPARPYMYLDNDDVISIKAEVKNWILRQIGDRRA